ncbi:MAG: LysM peptidoglycan-binding domain-containing protein [Oscillospiraceae bacterium]|nr:LysM peptidoglycan-binding domain-containing protein [Oscillospiraceae bacterium]
MWHRVKKGESLWKIARDYGVEPAAVIALNPQIKNPNLIYVGQEVRVK